MGGGGRGHRKVSRRWREWIWVWRPQRGSGRDRGWKWRARQGRARRISGTFGEASVDFGVIGKTYSSFAHFEAEEKSKMDLRKRRDTFQDGNGDTVYRGF